MVTKFNFFICVVMTGTFKIIVCSICFCFHPTFVCLSCIELSVLWFSNTRSFKCTKRVRTEGLILSSNFVFTKCRCIPPAQMHNYCLKIS